MIKTEEAKETKFEMHTIKKLAGSAHEHNKKEMHHGILVEHGAEPKRTE